MNSPIAAAATTPEVAPNVNPANKEVAPAEVNKPLNAPGSNEDTANAPKVAPSSDAASAR